MGAAPLDAHVKPLKVELVSLEVNDTHSPETSGVKQHRPLLVFLTPSF